ncbi:universal stress protein [Cytophagaceae bacterium ABcell3]|nr:universal stress protein [Cytophagaceae bacterium ABcell3]
MIKKAPIPFEKIAVAVALSPRVEEIICESVRFAKLFDASLIFIHISQEGEDLELLKRLIDKYAEAVKHELVLEKGDVVDSILKISKKNAADLLIAGALEKESYLRYYLGSVSRKLSRKAKCSVLLLKEPSLHPKPFNTMVVSGPEHPKTVHTVKAAAYFAEREYTSEVFLVKENELSGLATFINEDFEDSRNNYKKQVVKEEYARMDKLIKQAGVENTEVKPVLLEGKPGYEMGRFARSNRADLLIINSADSHKGFFERIFPDELEYVLENLPCSLLIVHSRV